MGAITYREAFSYDIGFLQYLWYIVMKEGSKKKAAEKKDLEKIEDGLEGG